MQDDERPDDDEGDADPEVQEIQEEYGLDEETAERVRDIRDEYGIDEDEAVELEELI